MTLYCQHAPKLRIGRPGQPKAASERPQHPKTREYTDGKAGTQVEIPDDAVDLDLEFALRTGAVAPLPCPDHPEAPPAEGSVSQETPGKPAGKGASGG